MEDKEIRALKTALRILLEEYPLGLSEYDLIQALAAPTGLVPEGFGREPLALFRTHFTLFSALYELQDEFLSERRVLEIGPLNIRLRSMGEGDGTGALTDGGEARLKAYYLDRTHLEKTKEGDVEEMLADFWRRFAAGGERRHALEVLGLDEAAGYTIIRRRYRTLAARHHPDRGGDAARLQEINGAMEILERYYRGR